MRFSETERHWVSAVCQQPSELLQPGCTPSTWGKSANGSSSDGLGIGSADSVGDGLGVSEGVRVGEGGGVEDVTGVEGVGVGVLCSTTGDDWGG